MRTTSLCLLSRRGPGLELRLLHGHELRLKAFERELMLSHSAQTTLFKWQKNIFWMVCLPLSPCPPPPHLQGPRRAPLPEPERRAASNAAAVEHERVEAAVGGLWESTPDGRGRGRRSDLPLPAAALQNACRLSFLWRGEAARRSGRGVAWETAAGRRSRVGGWEASMERRQQVNRWEPVLGGCLP